MEANIEKDVRRNQILHAKLHQGEWCETYRTNMYQHRNCEEPQYSLKPQKTNVKMKNVTTKLL